MTEVLDKAVAALQAKLAGGGFDGVAKFVIDGEGAVMIDGDMGAAMRLGSVLG